MKAGTIVYKGKTKKGKEIIIRYPLRKDLQIMADYINTLSKERTFIIFQGEQVTLEEEKKYIESQIEKIEKNQAIKLLAFIGNKLVGSSDIYLEEKTSSHVGVFGLTVAKDFRREGIGKLLISLVLEEAKKNMKNLRIITLGVFEGNNIAKNLYKKFGFKKYGKLPQGIKYKDKYIDHIYMYLFV